MFIYRRALTCPDQTLPDTQTTAVPGLAREHSAQQMAQALVFVPSARITAGRAPTDPVVRGYSMGGFEGLADVGRYTTSLGHLQTVLTGPMPNGLGLLRGHSAADDLLAHHPPGLAQLMPGLDESLQLVSQPGRVLGGEIDLVLVLVDAETDSLDTVFGAVEIVNK